MKAWHAFTKGLSWDTLRRQRFHCAFGGLSAVRVRARSDPSQVDHAHLGAHAGPRLHHLVPQLERRVDLFDTDAMPELIAPGRRCAHEALPQPCALWAQAEPGMRAA